ncbi:MAG TPA: HEAT repeat domain-containing protein [Candidatus Binatia bacterium]|nr:HEAT repeat domain-containing protein [Candidatus Binatia bacterium]
MVNDFLKLSPAGQVRFLKTEQFAQIEKDQRLEFLKEIALNKTISSKCLAAALKILRELKFRDHAFYNNFLQHPDSSVILACKKALSERGQASDSGFFTMRELLKKQNHEKKMAAVTSIISETDQSAEDLLLSLLNEDNLKIRELIVKELSGRVKVDERKLLEQLPHAIWYCRGALIEILGNRRSPLLLEIIGQLIADANVEVRMKLLAAMVKLDREQVKEHVLTMTRDPHPRVCREAKRLLATI